MKKLKSKLFCICLFSIATLTACSSDDSSNSENTSSSGQSITLNFTQGQFTGVLNNSNFQNGVGGASRFQIDNETSYLLVYGNGVNQFNGHITNKNSGQLSSLLDNESNDNNIVTIMSSGKRYTSTSGTFNISQEQVISDQSGMEMIKCKFTFNGTFKATSLTSDDVIENNVKINGTVNF